MIDCLTRPFEWAFRLMGLVILMTYGFALKLWFSLMPLFEPIIRIYQSIDYDNVDILSVLEAITRATLMVAIFNWKIVQAVWELVTSPFENLICRLMEALRKLNDKFHIVEPHSYLLQPRHGQGQRMDHYEGHDQYGGPYGGRYEGQSESDTSG